MQAGMRALAPGQQQRAAEAAVVAACMTNGADGIAFWPWIMSGPNGLFGVPFQSFGSYRHLNRTMQEGELVRVDVGCESDHYQGDVGRTAPVSGRFTPGQREAWNLLVHAYRAGLNAMHDGVAWSTVVTASRRAVQAAAPGLLTSLGREATTILLSDDGIAWHHHAIGLHASEAAPDTLRAGMVIDFEPMFALDGEGYYLEDMILITSTAYEILTPGLPYSAEEIEAAMAKE
jgi:Xaa-Pro aminopeptidase